MRCIFLSDGSQVSVHAQHEIAAYVSREPEKAVCIRRIDASNAERREEIIEKFLVPSGALSARGMGREAAIPCFLVYTEGLAVYKAGQVGTVLALVSALAPGD